MKSKNVPNKVVNVCGKVVGERQGHFKAVVGTSCGTEG